MEFINNFLQNRLKIFKLCDHLGDVTYTIIL